MKETHSLTMDSIYWDKLREIMKECGVPPRQYGEGLRIYLMESIRFSVLQDIVNSLEEVDRG